MLKPRCVRLPSCGASCRLDANQDMPNCCQSPYALPPLMPCRAVGWLAAIMVNKFFIRINFNYVGFMLQIYAHRAQCVHFITQQKLTNRYNKNSTIKAKPLIFSGLALFFTFFKPRHPISVKKLRANRRFLNGKMFHFFKFLRLLIILVNFSLSAADSSRSSNAPTSVRSLSLPFSKMLFTSIPAMPSDPRSVNSGTVGTA